MSDNGYDPKLGQQVTINGCARDAAMGAVVLTEDRTPIYVDGLREWDEDIEGEDIEATGILRRRSLAPDPVVDEDGAVSHGAEGTNYVLEGASWNRA
jgi:hypothetical protein